MDSHEHNKESLVAVKILRPQMLLNIRHSFESPPLEL